ncbi:hypothetical protein Lser_V15G38157 [Lactuca serriola]
MSVILLHVLPINVNPSTHPPPRILLNSSLSLTSTANFHTLQNPPSLSKGLDGFLTDAIYRRLGFVSGFPEQPNTPSSISSDSSRLGGLRCPGVVHGIHAQDENKNQRTIYRRLGFVWGFPEQPNTPSSISSDASRLGGLRRPGVVHVIQAQDENKNQ